MSTLASLYRQYENHSPGKTTVCFALHYIIVHADATTAYQPAGQRKGWIRGVLKIFLVGKM